MRGPLRAAALGAAAVLALLAAACGSSARPASSSQLVPVFSVPVPKAPPAPKVPVVATPSAGLQQVRWLAILAQTGQVLTLSYDLQGCRGPALQATIGHSASQVSITLWDRGPAAGQLCADDIRPAKVAITVTVPLAGRTVVDG